MLPALAVSLTVLSFWYSQRPLPPATSNFKQVQQEAARGGYRLITTGKLWELQQSGPEETLLVDTRQEWEYRTGHIKGAVNFTMEPTAWARWREKGPLEKLLGKNRERNIVFY